MTGILLATLMRLTAPQLVAAPSGEASVDDLIDLIDPFAERATRPDAAPASSDLIDPFNHPPRRHAPIDCSESVLRDPFATPLVPRPSATFPGLIDPFAQ